MNTFPADELRPEDALDSYDQVGNDNAQDTPDDASEYNPPSIHSRAPTEATVPAYQPSRPVTEEEVLEMLRIKAENTARFAAMQASCTQDPKILALCQAELEQNQRAAEELKGEIEELRFEEWLDRVEEYDKEYDARQQAKAMMKATAQAATESQLPNESDDDEDSEEADDSSARLCDYAVIDALLGIAFQKDTVARIHKLGDSLCDLGAKLGVQVTLSFHRVGLHPLLSFAAAADPEEDQFSLAYNELVSITEPHLHPRLQFQAVIVNQPESAPQSPDLEIVSSHRDEGSPGSTSNVPPFHAPDTPPINNPIPAEADATVSISALVGDFNPVIEDKMHDSMQVQDTVQWNHLGLASSTAESSPTGDSLFFPQHVDLLSSQTIHSATPFGETESGLWNNLCQIFAAHGYRIELRYSYCISRTPPPLSPLGGSDVAIHINLLFSQLFALCWIRGLHIELHYFPLSEAPVQCPQPDPSISEPAQPFELKSIPKQAAWWKEQARIEKESVILENPITFSSHRKSRRWFPYSMRKRSTFRTVFVC